MRALKSPCVFLTILVAFLPAAPAAAADLFRGIRLPPELGGFERGKITDFEAKAPGLGTGVAYSAPGIKATVFVYDLEFRGLPEGTDNAIVQTQAKQALADILAAQSGARVLEALAPATGACSGFLRAKLRYVESRTGEVLHSHLYLGSRSGSFVKLRLSYGDDVPTVVAAASEARFAQALCGSVAR